MQTLARKMTEDDVPNRGDKFTAAVYEYVKTSAAFGELDEAVDLITARFPEFENPYRSGVPPNFGAACAGVERFLLPGYTESGLFL